MRALIAKLPLLLLCAALAACHSDRAAKEKGAAPIGVAHMLDDGTIVLDLRTNDTGLVGESRLSYPKSSKDYKMILDHIGGIKPGEAKSVPPWPGGK